MAVAGTLRSVVEVVVGGVDEGGVGGGKSTGDGGETDEIDEPHGDSAVEVDATLKEEDGTDDCDDVALLSQF